jgi:subtilisin family serine protease
MKIARKAVFLFLFVVLFSGTFPNFINTSVMNVSSTPLDNYSLENSSSSNLPFSGTPSKKFIDPELLNSVGLARVIVITTDDMALNDVSKHMASVRATPSFKGFRIVRGLMSSENIMKLAADSHVLSIIKDKKINYDVPVEFPTFSSFQDILKFRFQTPESEEWMLGKPETTLRDVTNITGAEKAWETYDINGTGTTIAIVDTGVDYGAPSLGYSDAVARDWFGYPAAFDADGESMVITNMIVTNTFTVTGTDKWLETNGTDPYIYVSPFAFEPYYLVPPIVRWSDLMGGTLPFPMNITGIESQSGSYHFGLMFQYLFGFDLFPVLIVDSVTAGVYDKVYVDMSFDWAWLSIILSPPYNLYFGTWPPEFSFADETPVTPTGRTVAARDFTGDGIYDLSVGSLGYFLDVWAASPNMEDRGQVLKPIAPDGDYAVFVNDWAGHGTSCASCAAGRELSIPSIDSRIYSGMAPGAKIMGITALFMGDVIEADLWAAGFDLVSGSEGWRNVTGYGTVWGTWNYTGNHKADVISHSWGWSDWAEGSLGMPWYSVLTVFEDALTVPGYFAPDYPGTVIVHAGGNGAAGYGTVTEPAYATLPITVGASTSMNWSRIAFGFAGGSYDEVIPWSARGPTPLGNVKPDVVNIGARGWAATPVWYGIGDGSLAYDLFGGTSMAAPLTAGASALTIQAYNQRYGDKPSPELTKVILKSSAKDLGYDAFVQGSGRVDAFAAVELVLAISGVTVTSSATWENIRSKIAYAWATSYNSLGEPLSFAPPAMPIGDVNWFAGTINPGESAITEFTIENPANQSIVATITPVTHEQVGSSLVYSGYTEMMPFDWISWDWSWGNLTKLKLSDIPSGTELMVASLWVPYEYFDENADYSWDRRWGICILDWVDANHDGNVDVNEVYLLNYGYNFGTSNEARVGFPLSKIKGEPVILVYQRGVLDAVPFKMSISYYERNNWTWVETPTNISVSSGSFETFIANLIVPPNAPQGVYEGQIIINITAPYSRTIAIPVSLQVPAILPADDLVYNLTSPSTSNLYDSFKVNGYFDWSWRYESGDWKQWVFNLQDSAVVAAFVSSTWTGEMTDIDMFGINPMGIMVDAAVSPNLGDMFPSVYTGGTFLWQTRTGTNEEYVVLNTSNFAYSQPGIYTVLLHNVLFDGMIYPENVTGKVELVKLLPRGPANVAAHSGHLASQSFTIASGRRLTNIRLFAYPDLNPFPVEFWPDYISSIDAMSSEEFTVRIDIPNDIPEGIYPSCFFFQADELPFPVLVLINVVVDSTSPTVTIVSPKNAANVQGGISIEAYANDINGIEGMEFEVETTSVTMTFDNVTGHWIASLDTTTLGDGLHAINVKATDKAGNVGSTSVAVTIDNTGPLVSIDAPANNSYLHGITKINITGEDANFKRAELYIDGRLVATWTVSGANSYQWNTTAFTDGVYIIALKVYDYANNFAADEISVTVDNTPPIAEIRTPTVLDYVKDDCNITIFAYDANLKLIQLSIDGSNMTSWHTNGIHSFIWSASSINGVRVIALNVYDKAGTKTEKTIAVTVDNTLPSVSITRPQAGADLSGTIMISFTVSDTNLESVQLLIDQSIFDVTNTTSFQWGTTTVGDGQHIIRLMAYDKAGNIGGTSITVTVDNRRPFAKIDAPANGSYVHGVTEINITGEDANFNRAELFMNGRLAASWNVDGTNTYQWNTSAFTDGAYIIALKVYDYANNFATDEISVVVDNTSPSVSMITPKAGADLSGTITINFAASDTNLELVQLLIDQSIFDVTNTTSFQWGTTTVGDGQHIIRLMAYDKAGNTAETSVSVNTINSKLNLEANKNLYLMIGTPLGFMLGVLIAYVILKRKK